VLTLSSSSKYITGFIHLLSSGSFPPTAPLIRVWMPVQNWNPRTAEEINANSLQEFYLSFFNNRGFSSARRSVYPDHYPERRLETHCPSSWRIWIFASFIPYTQSSKCFRILDKLATLIDAVVYINRQILIPA
jgi:hypothetical protein